MTQTEIKDYPTYDNIAPKQPEILQELEAVDKDDLVNKKVLFSEVHFLNGADGEFSVSKVVVDGTDKKLVIGGVVCKKLKEIKKENIPFYGTIVRKKGEISKKTYYTLE